MPSKVSLPISISEMLECRREPLKELEIWALLCLTSEVLQDIIMKGEDGKGSLPNYMVTPNTLLVHDDGQVSVSEGAEDHYDSVYSAPEVKHYSRHAPSDISFEKMFIFSLGRTLQVACEFGLKEHQIVNISLDLDSLLEAMTEENAVVRMGLIHIFEACALQARQQPHRPSHTSTLVSLYRSILYGDKKVLLDDSAYGSEARYRRAHRARQARSPKARRTVRHHRDRSDDISSHYSRSRSRSRSRSLSRNRRDIQDSGAYGSSYQHRQAEQDSASSILNSSMASSERGHEHPVSRASQSVEGLLGKRQGSPAYKKYVQLKERQMRLRQARTNGAWPMMHGSRMPLMQSGVSMDNVSQNHSMSSLMSFTLGSYRPGLYDTVESGLDWGYSHEALKDRDHTLDDQLNSLFNEMQQESSNWLQSDENVQPKTTLPSYQQAEPQIPNNQREPRVQRSQAGSQFSQSPASVIVKNVISEPTLASASASAPAESNPAVKSKEGRRVLPAIQQKPPEINIEVPVAGQGLKHVPVSRQLTVIHLTGQRVNVRLDPNTTGRQLFDIVIPHIDLDDFFFFGLTYLSDGQHYFVDADCKLHKIAPVGWKDAPKGHIPTTFNLYVRVKFYPESLTDFRHPSSYHLLYLQLRSDIVEGRITCQFETLVKLAGLALQAECGDHAATIASSADRQYFIVEQYCPPKTVYRKGASHVFTEASKQHKMNTGIPCSQAEIEYIKTVRLLSDYGIHFFKLLRTKDTQDFIWVGLSQHSLILAEMHGAERVITQNYPWGSILKISFNKRRFSIQPKVDVARGKPPKISFYTHSYKEGKYLLQFSTDQHRFQIRMRTRPSNMEVLSGDFLVDPSPQTADAGVGEDEIGEEFIGSNFASPTSYVDPSLQSLPEDDDEFGEEEESNAPSYHRRQLSYRNPPPYQPPRMSQLLKDLHAFMPDVTDLPLQTSPQRGVKHQRMPEKQDLHSLDGRSRTSSLASSLTYEKDDAEDPSPPSYPGLLLPISQSGRHVFEVTLDKEPDHGIGLTIVGGEATSSLDLGIFVKSLTPGGPAERDGRIKPGDRLIAIGGTSLEGMQHHEAVALIRNGRPSVTLLVSQSRPTLDARRRGEDSSRDPRLSNIISDHATYDPVQQEYYYHNVHTFPTRDLHDDDVDPTDTNFADYLDDFDRRSFSSNHSEGALESEENYSLQSASSRLNHHAPSHNHSSLPKQTPSSRHNQKSLQFEDERGLSTKHPYSSPKSYMSSNKNLPPSQSPKDQAYSKGNRSPSQQSPRETGHTYKKQTGPSQPQATSQSTQQLKNTYPSYSRDLADGSNPLNLSDDEEFSYQLALGEIQKARQAERPSPVNVRSRQELTDEDREDLQILGDIAALDVEDSSSDSDFETAIKNTIEGTSLNMLADGKVVNAVSPTVGRTFNLRDVTDHRPDVIYEVLLKKQGDSLGFVPCFGTDPGFSSEQIFIKEIIPGSSAEQGGILAPGDRVLEINSEALDGVNSESLQHIVMSAPSLCPVKVARSAIRDSAIMRGQQILLEQPVEDRWHPRQESQPNRAISELDSLGFHPIQEQNQHAIPPVYHTDRPNEDTGPATQSHAVSQGTKPYLNQVPIPPVRTMSLHEGSQSNTQSDVDSDVLDSPRSDIEMPFSVTNRDTLRNRGLPQNRDSSQLSDKQRPKDSVQRKHSESNLDANKDENINKKGAHGERRMSKPLVKNISFDQESVSSGQTDNGFKEHLAVLRTELDERLKAEGADSSQSDSVALDVISTKGTGRQNEKLNFAPPPPARSDDGDSSLSHRQEHARKAKRSNSQKVGDQKNDVIDKLGRLVPTLEKDKYEDNSGSPVATSKKDNASVDKPKSPLNARHKNDLADLEAKLAIGQLDNDDSSESSSSSVITQQLKVSPQQSKPSTGLDPCEPLLVKVKLVKTGKSFGFTVAGGINTGGCFVKQLVGDPAKSEGTLHPGDKIVQVNSVDVTHLNHKEAVSLLRTMPNEVVLCVLRYPTSLETQHRLTQLQNDAFAFTKPRDVFMDLSNPESMQSHSGKHMNAPKAIIKPYGYEEELTESDTTERTSQADESSLTGRSKADEDPSLKDDYSPASELDRADVKVLKYKCPRALSVDVPVVVSEEWLSCLPLVKMPLVEDEDDEGSESYTTQLLQSLADLVESGEPYEEFKNLRLMKEASPCEAGQVSENRNKNRYRNVLPYDVNRVKLKQSGESDYINASYINMKIKGCEDAPLKYIACQGPVAEACWDFWEMLIQEETNVVVMLTKIVEGGKIKCYSYWPTTKEEPVDLGNGALRVNLLRSYTVDEINVYELSIEGTAIDEPRAITLLQFASWLDHGTPETALPLLKLIQLMHLMERGSPPVVHCSAGIGRTGAFIAVDVALCTIEKSKEVDLFEIVKDLRSQRHGMIQTTEQYLFCYTACMEALLSTETKEESV